VVFFECIDDFAVAQALWEKAIEWGNQRGLTIKSVLVAPDYWGSGVAILMFDEMQKRVRAKGYRWVDFSLTSTDNPRTPALAERVGAKIYKATPGVT
jgi:hypothetical protein